MYPNTYIYVGGMWEFTGSFTFSLLLLESVLESVLKPESKQIGFILCACLFLKVFEEQLVLSLDDDDEDDDEDTEEYPSLLSGKHSLSL